MVGLEPSHSSGRMTKLKVHEVRFFDPKPRPIQGLAFDAESSRLAVVRCCVDEEDGGRPAAYYLEIWNLSDAPCVEFKIVLGREWRESVEAVCWRSKRYLYVSGMHGHVLLIDVETSRVVKSAAAVSGPVWCLGLNPSKTRLAAGTEDGFISLFNVEDEELLEYLSLLEPKGSRVLSLSWHPSKPLLVSSGRGRLWLWDMEHMTLRMEMRPPKNGKEEAIVSSVLLLLNDTVVSGDSAGSTIFWDTATGTPLTTFRSHRSGVLSLASRDTPEGMRVYASGIDSLITEMRLINTNLNSSHGGHGGHGSRGGAVWVTATPKYYHTHDVRALLHTGRCLVSGGADAQLCVATDQMKQLIKIPPNTDVSRVSVASSHLNPAVPLLLLQNSSRLEIWQLSENKEEEESAASVVKAAEHSLLLKLTLGKGKEIIHASALSPNGECLVVSSARLTKAYRVMLTKDARNHVEMNLVSAQLSEGALSLPVDHFAFSGSECLVVADGKGVYSCTVRSFSHHGQNSVLVEKKVDVYTLPSDERIRHLVASKNARFVALVTSRNHVEVIDTQEAASVSDQMEVEGEEGEGEEEGGVGGVGGRRTKWRCLTPPQSGASVVTAVVLTEDGKGDVGKPDLVIAYADGTVAVWSLQTMLYSRVEGVWRDGCSAYTHGSVQGSLVVLHNWREGVVLQREKKGAWNVKHFLSYDEHLISSVLSPAGDLVNVVQTPSMLQNQLPPALAKKVFGV